MLLHQIPHLSGHRQTMRDHSTGPKKKSRNPCLSAASRDLLVIQTTRSTMPGRSCQRPVVAHSNRPYAFAAAQSSGVPAYLDGAAAQSSGVPAYLDGAAAQSSGVPANVTAPYRRPILPHSPSGVKLRLAGCSTCRSPAIHSRPQNGGASTVGSSLKTLFRCTSPRCTHPRLPSGARTFSHSPPVERPSTSRVVLCGQIKMIA